MPSAMGETTGATDEPLAEKAILGGQRTVTDLMARGILIAKAPATNVTTGAAAPAAAAAAAGAAAAAIDDVAMLRG